MLIFLVLILIKINLIFSNHFNGGTINLTPVLRNINSTAIPILITQFYSWTYPTINCVTDVPTSTSWLFYPSVNLNCIANCSTQGAYSSNPISILTDCTSYSTSLGVLKSQRAVNITLAENTYFWIAYQGFSWRALENAVITSTPSWSIVSLINLRRRPDGLINSPPIAQISSPQYVTVNRSATILIPVSDLDYSDQLRCRWSNKTSIYGVDECADVCASTSTLSLANLSACTLTFTATTSNVWYAIALQVEDFLNTTSTNPMSSVAIQFLIYVLPTPNCTQLPAILPLTGCLEVQVNVTTSFTLYAINYCNRTKTIITDIIPTVSMDGVTATTLVNSTTNTSLAYVTFTWTPQTNQIGWQQFCALAYTNDYVQSDLYCVTFTVKTSQSCTTTTTTSTTTTTETTTSSVSTTTTTSQTTTTATTTTTTTTATTATTSTTTTTTSVSTTTVTTTSVTTETTTSVTTATETTTLASPKPSNLGLIIGLPLLGLFLVLSSTGLYMYYKKRSASMQQASLNKMRKGLDQELFSIHLREKSSNVPRIDKSFNDSLLSNSTERITVQKKTGENDLISVKKSSANPFKEENQSLELYQSNSFNANISRTLSPNAPTVMQSNECASAAITKVRVIKLPRNKVSISSRTDLENLWSNPNASFKANSVRSKSRNAMRRRASSFDGVTVQRIRTARTGVTSDHS